MLVFARILLALLLVIQPLPAWPVQCASAAPIDGPSTQMDAACGCCQGTPADEPSGCPVGGPAVSCHCGTARPVEPSSAPVGAAGEKLSEVLMAPPVLVAVLDLPAPRLAQRWTAPHGAPRQSIASVQSLLCVWVV